MKDNKLTVIDFFCGAGGFSEGFRQKDYKIILGVDNYEPAIRTFNHNFNLDCSTKNVLDYKNSLEEIEELPDSDIIIGSPPCVTFSSSNNSGKADKTSGVILTETFLRVIAIKKWKKGSRLKAWLMENVPSSKYHLKDQYTFIDLKLGKWASANNIKKSSIAITLKGNRYIVNSADYGSPQSRKRLITGEFINNSRLILPIQTHYAGEISNTSNKWIALESIKKKLPSPTSKKSTIEIEDPNYPWVQIRLDELTDHFYDTGLFECEWQQSRFYKINHPYMGKMSFPEDEKKPSRTITATKIGTSREAVIYKSEFNRRGDGEYRIPTVREAACIMGFPISFQFHGGENTKWRLIGNAVCPGVARAFAAQIKSELGFNYNDEISVSQDIKIDGIRDLNTFKEKKFETPPRKNKGSKFRRHLFKDGNLTVTLSNYDITGKKKIVDKWRTSVQYGNGDGFPHFNYPDYYYLKLEEQINSIENGERFIKIINNGFADKIANRELLQELFESQRSSNNFPDPSTLLEELKNIIDDQNIDKRIFMQNENIVFRGKESIHLKQLFALYGINKISTVANTI